LLNTLFVSNSLSMYDFINIFNFSLVQEMVYGKKNSKWSFRISLIKRRQLFWPFPSWSWAKICPALLY
jgi:hypothetical protein